MSVSFALLHGGWIDNRFLHAESTTKVISGRPIAWFGWKMVFSGSGEHVVGLPVAAEECFFSVTEVTLVYLQYARGKIMSMATTF